MLRRLTLRRSSVGAIRRVHRHLGAEADQLLEGRAQILKYVFFAGVIEMRSLVLITKKLILGIILSSVWRPLRGPVEEWPLAVMDGRSLKENHVHPTNIFKHQYNLQGQTVSISHSPEQTWYYLDQQKTDEVTFIKIWDSRDDVPSKCEQSLLIYQMVQ